MTSETAIEYLDDMIAKGLRPTPRDIIRLNAFGLKLEAVKAKDQHRPADPTWFLPRVARISRDVFFRQPAVGHEIWIESAMRWCARDDYQTLLAVNCYALSRDVDDLPDAADPENVRLAVGEFAAKLSRFTRDQLFAAIDYVKFGFSPSALEPAAESDAAGPDGDREPPGESPDECVALGALYQGVSVLWGLTLADMKRMTREQLRAAIRNAYTFHDRSLAADPSGDEAAFYSVLSEIKDRLVAESNNHGSN